MSKRITNDTEYWQLRDDYQNALAVIEQESDKKRKKELTKSSQELKKVLDAYEKKKMKDTQALVKKEIKLSNIRNKAKAGKQIFFNISAIESKYHNIADMDEKMRNKLSVKKESMIEMMKKGMYVKLKDDSGIYQVKQRDDYMDGMRYISTARYGDVPIQDVALMIDHYFYESELSRTGHKVN